jgi:hypothetical protein
MFKPDPIYGPFRWRYLVFAAGVLFGLLWPLSSAVRL